MSETTPPGKPDPLVMPADEFAALKVVAEAAGEQLLTPEEIAGLRERFAAAMANQGPFRVRWKDRAEAAEATLAAIREVLTTSLTDTGDGLGVLQRPADDGAMLDRALRLIGRLLATIGSEEETRDDRA